MLNLHRLVFFKDAFIKIVSGDYKTRTIDHVMEHNI